MPRFSHRRVPVSHVDPSGACQEIFSSVAVSEGRGTPLTFLWTCLVLRPPFFAVTTAEPNALAWVCTLIPSKHREALLLWAPWPRSPVAPPDSVRDEDHRELAEQGPFWALSSCFSSGLCDLHKAHSLLRYLSRYISFLTREIPGQRMQLPHPRLLGLVRKGGFPGLWGPREGVSLLGWATSGLAPDSTSASCKATPETPLISPSLSLLSYFYPGAPPCVSEQLQSGVWEACPQVNPSP